MYHIVWLNNTIKSSVDLRKQEIMKYKYNLISSTKAHNFSLDTKQNEKMSPQGIWKKQQPLKSFPMCLFFLARSVYSYS